MAKKINLDSTKLLGRTGKGTKMTGSTKPVGTVKPTDR